MFRYYRRIALALCAAMIFVFFVGCARHEHRKVQVKEEQRAGEVHEDKPGEMVVE
jgi:hypothetical protein